MALEPIVVCSARTFTRCMWQQVLAKGDCIVDATLGKGYDAWYSGQMLQKMGGGSLIGIDKQGQVMEEAQKRCAPLDKVHQTYLQQCHSKAIAVRPKLVLYNLGYCLSGDPDFKTCATTTLQSVAWASSALVCGGLISLTCYIGHVGGEAEYAALLAWASALPTKEWLVTLMQWPNRQRCPRVLLLQKVAKEQTKGVQSDRLGY